MAISNAQYKSRRSELMLRMAPNSIAIVPSASEKIRSRDTDYVFRQNSDLLYLCGFEEPQSVLVLIPGREDGEFVLFCRKRDKDMEIWNGYRAGPEGAVKKYRADETFAIDDIDQILPTLIEGCERIYYPMGRDPKFDQQVMGWSNQIRSKARSGAVPPSEIAELDKLLHELRLYKSSAEIKLMQQAAEIAAAAHSRAMTYCKPGQYEYQLEAEILHEFGRNGARHPAYTSIVGGGENACVLHYVENNAELKDGELVLIDAGCEYQYYASDITRTFPVNGVFSREQKLLYELVLKAQLAAIKKVRPGNHWNEPHEAAVRVLCEGLLKLGLLEGELEQIIEDGSYKQFYMHRTGHWLGMDVHDVGRYKIDGQWRELEPGMVLTVEPGLYVSADQDTVAKKWRGIGIRIEDDVLVTKGGCKVLTAGVPKSVKQIEALMAGQKAVDKKARKKKAG